MDFLYEPLSRGAFRATHLTRGPWSPTAQHGGPPAALLIGELEKMATPVAMDMVRCTVDLLRPVPIADLDVATSVVRPGKRAQLSEATMHHGDTEVARARAWFIATQDSDVGEHPTGPAPYREPDATSWWPGTQEGYHMEAVELRRGRPSETESEAVPAWIRLLVDVVAGERPTPNQRVGAAADFGNGVSRVLDPRQHIFINTDLGIYLARPPRGDWIGLRALTVTGGRGVGVAESSLFDDDGRIGTSVQALLISRSLQ